MGKCGTKAGRIWSKCNSPNPSDFIFCGKCGHGFGESPRSSPAPVAFDKAEPKTYTPKHLADKILTTRRSLEGERKLVTVMFADVAGFTAISEKLDPEDVHRIMDDCCRILVDEIHRFEGTIGEFRGDGVMALFGAPIAHEDHAQRACYTALANLKKVEAFFLEMGKDYWLGKGQVVSARL